MSSRETVCLWEKCLKISIPIFKSSFYTKVQVFLSYIAVWNLENLPEKNNIVLEELLWFHGNFLSVPLYNHFPVGITPPQLGLSSVWCAMYHDVIYPLLGIWITDFDPTARFD